jgi:hypothetical protein
MRLAPLGDGAVDECMHLRLQGALDGVLVLGMARIHNVLEHHLCTRVTSGTAGRAAQRPLRVQPTAHGERAHSQKRQRGNVKGSARNLEQGRVPGAPSATTYERPSALVSMHMQATHLGLASPSDSAVATDEPGWVM